MLPLRLLPGQPFFGPSENNMRDEPEFDNSALPLAVKPYPRGLVPEGYVLAQVAPQPNPDGEGDEEGAGLLDYWHILLRHKVLLAGFACLGALLGFAFAFPRTPEYQAKTSIEFVGLNQDFLNMKGAIPITTEGGSAFDNVSEIQTQIALLQSDSLAQRVIARIKQSPPPTTASEPPLASLRKALHLGSADAPTLDQLLKGAAKSVRAKPSGQTRLIQITVDSSNPVLAARFVNTLAQEFIQQSLESRWKVAESTSEWLSTQLEATRQKLEKSQKELQQYAEKSGLIFTGERDSVSEAKLRQLQQELSAAQADRIAKQSRSELAQTTPADALPQVLDDPGLREIRLKILDLRRQIAQLSETYTPEYAKLKRAQAELSTLEAAFERNKAEILNSLKNQYDEATRRERLLTQAYNSQTTRVTADGEKSIQYDILKREVDSNQQLYQNMLSELKESTLASAMHASNARVVDPARVPLRPYKPNIPQTTGLGFVAGAFLGAAFLVLRDHSNRAIQQPGESSLLLHTPELGVIPSAQVDLRRTRSNRALSSLTIISPNGALAAGDSVQAVAWKRQTSVLSDSFRSSLLSILLSSQDSGKPKVLVITSAGPREGKSTVTSNLGIAAAELGQKVLLIDADIRKPTLHRIFQMDNQQGLSTILLKMASLNQDQSVLNLIRETGVPGLSLLSSGPATSAATKLLYTSYTRHMLQYLRGQFDLILIDTPPGLHIPDARVLGPMADSVVTVIWAGHTTRDAAVATCRRLREDGSRLLGTILNNWDPKSASRDSLYYDPKYYYGESHGKSRV
jgi:capsular exopolysaccharide synthesis family protein